ncbi:protein SLC31A2 isoform X1 [Pogona vitticeps]
MMPMYFYFSDQVVLLFDFWNVRSPAGMVLSVVVILLLALLYEAIKVAKAKVILRMMPALVPSVSQETLREPEQASINAGLEQPAGTSKNPFLWHVAQTLLHIAHVVLGYLVMLAVMSYNAWVFLGAIVGSTVGYYVAYPFLSIQ